MRKDQSADQAYPAGRNLLASWSRTESAGELALTVPGSSEPLRMRWQGYRCLDGSYTASYFGEQFLCSFSYRETALQLSEHYVDVSITNSGRFERKFEHEGSEACATELVRAKLEGRPLQLAADPERPNAYFLVASAERDHTFHEIEIEELSCQAHFDLSALIGVLERRRFRDSST